MKIVHVATTDGGSGAAIAAYRLHRSLRDYGVDSEMFVAEKRTDDPHVLAFRPPRDFLSRVRRRARGWHISRNRARYRRSGATDAEWLSDDRSVHRDDVLAQLPAADVINVHAMYDFIDYRAFFAHAPKHAPVVRTLHDISFFTGGCHYAGDCEKYTERCGACPQLGSEDEHDLSRQIWERKLAAFNTIPSGRLHVVTPSTWLANEARRSSLLRGAAVTVLPLGLDVDVFRPMDRALARDVFGIPQNARVVLFVAQPVSRRLKGFTFVAQAVEGLGAMKNVLLVSAGGGQPPVKVGAPHLHLGQIRDERLLALLYGAADVFVMPSLQEAFGLTALEATASGTPVVAFAVGGLLDTVRPSVTGLLTPAQDVLALRNGIRELLEDPARRREMSVNCRRVAIDDYSLRAQAERYSNFYRDVVEQSARNPR